MKPLLSATEMRNAIRKVLRSKNDDRTIAVGFVGADPLEWLPTPAGITLYCWPRAGGTHPDGIDALLAADVDVRFVDRLHTKIYFGRRTGVVMGSANLSHNALMDGGLIEAGMLLGPGNGEIEKFLLALERVAIGSGDPRYAGIIEKLRVDDMLFRQRNPQPRGKSTSRKSLRTFGKWLDMPHREQLQLGWWSENRIPPEDATAIYEEKHNGASSYANWRSGSDRTELKPGVATIDCKIRASRWGITFSPAPFWWYPEPPIVSADRQWSDAPYQWFAQVNVPPGRAVPFDLTEERFRKALDATVRDYGEAIYELRGPVEGEFMTLLARHYNVGAKKTRTRRKDRFERVE